MSKICYVQTKFSSLKQSQIARANEIIADYHAQGFDLTVRQLYYQFVARGWIPNNSSEYGKLQGLINDARLAGEIDWDAIVDRTRNLRAIRHYDHPRDALLEAAQQFTYWKWEDQPNYVEVWVEKDALLGIVGQACNELDVPFFSCRGYTSVSEVHSAAMRFKYEMQQGKTVLVIHLGDHDPSGIDMTRDIKNRLTNVFGADARIYRCALNMDQIQKYNPPPNPAKMTDSRASGYIEEHGTSSWELDALPPEVLVRVIQSNIRHWMDEEKFQARLAKEQRARNTLDGMAQRWNDVYNFVRQAPEIVSDVED